MGTIPLPKRCGLYLPGHEVHWIQGLHSSDAGEVAPVPCRILAVSDDGTIAVNLAGERLELWTHDPGRLRALVAECGAAVTYQKRWRLLRVAHDGGSYCIDVTPASSPERRACPTSPPRHETPAVQLAATGGFTVRATDIVAPIDRLGSGR